MQGYVTAVIEPDDLRLNEPQEPILIANSVFLVRFLLRLEHEFLDYQVAALELILAFLVSILKGPVAKARAI